MEEDKKECKQIKLENELKEKEPIIRKLGDKIDEFEASKIENARNTVKLSTLFQVRVIDEECN